jgi:hypothetical protein
LGDRTGDYKVNAYCNAASGGSPQTFTAKAAQDIKIEIKAEKTLLSPLTDADNTGPSGARVIDFSKVRATKITVTVKQNEEPLPNHPIKLQSIPVAYSGGHDHNSDRRKGSFVAADGTEATGETTLKSDSNGIVEVTYKSSGIAGIETIEASSAESPDIKASADVILKIDGLMSMPVPSDNLPYSSYYLVGSYGEPGVSSMHRNNHYGTWGTVNALVQIANGFNRRFPGNPLYYNDMSLPWGGPFDIYNNWRNPHLGHREGKNADIRFTNVNTVGQYLEYVRLLTTNNGRITFTHSDHWHIHFAQ